MDIVLYVSLFIMFICSAILLSMLTNTPIIRNYKTSNGLTKYIKQQLHIEIEKVNTGKHRTEIKFKDGSVLNLWTSNKMYAYASDGDVTKADGDKFSWSSEMPSRLVNLKLLKAIEENTYK